MALSTGAITAKQLAAMPDDGKRYELVVGELRMMSPAGGRHGRVAFKLGLMLGNHVLEQQLGMIFAAETGFLIERDPDTVRAPDVAFVARARVQQIADEIGYVPLAPDLVGEVVSPNDSFSEVEEKALGWLKCGTRMVLVLDPACRTVHVYRAADDIVVLDESATLDTEDVVPGWKLPVRELFT